MDEHFREEPGTKLRLTTRLIDPHIWLTDDYDAFYDSRMAEPSYTINLFGQLWNEVQYIRYITRSGRK